MSWLTIPEPERRQLTRRLTQRQLDIYTMRHARLSYEWIADYYGISIRTVRTHEHRARQVHDRIRHELQQEAAA